MGHAGDTHHLAVVVNDVHDAVIADADAPEILVYSQLLAAGRSWIGGEALDLPPGGWLDFEGVSSQADDRV